MSNQVTGDGDSQASLPSMWPWLCFRGLASPPIFQAWPYSLPACPVVLITFQPELARTCLCLWQRTAFFFYYAFQFQVKFITSQGAWFSLRKPLVSLCSGLRLTIYPASIFSLSLFECYASFQKLLLQRLLQAQPNETPWPVCGLHPAFHIHPCSHLLLCYIGVPES